MASPRDLSAQRRSATCNALCVLRSSQTAGSKREIWAFCKASLCVRQHSSSLKPMLLYRCLVQMSLWRCECHFFRICKLDRWQGSPACY